MYIYTVLIAADTITCIINIGVYVALISVQKKSRNIHVHVQYTRRTFDIITCII